MNARFTRLAVRTTPKAKSFVVVYPEIRDGAVVGISPLFGTVIPLRASMQAITAGQQSSDATRTGEGGSLFSIAVKDVTRKPESLAELFLRNPWQNKNAEAFVKAFQN